MPDWWNKGRHRWANAIAETDLPDLAKLLAYRIMAKYADRYTGECVRKIDGKDDGRTTPIAVDLKKSPRAIRRALSALEAAGWIAPDRTGGAGCGVHIVPSWPAEKAGNIVRLSRQNPDDFDQNPDENVRLPYIRKNPVPIPEGAQARTVGATQPWHRGHLRRIPPNGHEVGGWTDWLRTRALGELGHYDLAQPSGELIVPLRLPPDPDNRVEQGLCLDWFRCRAQHIEQRRASHARTRLTGAA